jgi:tRNA(fMet)-specific endonuclease VapC
MSTPARSYAAERIYVPVVVIAELKAGFQAGTKTLENEMILNAFIRKSTVLEIDLLTAQHYANVMTSQREKGQPIPTNDIWIAAIALRHQLPLLTFDAHFRNIDALNVVQTLEEFNQLHQAEQP